MLKKCTRLWRKAHSEVKMLKNWRPRSTFWSSDVESSGAILKSKCAKCTKHDVFGPLLYALMLKKCTPEKFLMKFFLKFRCFSIGLQVATHSICKVLSFTLKPKQSCSRLVTFIHHCFCSAICDSQQHISPIGFLFWNFRHRLVRYYWYSICIYIYILIYSIL